MAEDRDFLRIYADPSIPHEEKLRLLSGDDLPEMPKPAPPEGRLALGDGVGGGGNVPESRADVGPSYSSGAGGSSGQPDPNVDTRPTSVQSPTAVPGATELRTQATADQEADAAIAHLSPEAQQEARAARAATTGDPAAAGEETILAGYPGGDDERQGPSAGGFRAALDRAVLQRPGKAVGMVPQEQVSEESVVERGSFSPEARAQYAAQQAEADRLQLEAQALQIDQEERANRVQLESLNKQAEEARALQAIQREEFAKARRARERANAISEEIAAMPPAEEGLFVGKNFGESLLTAIGILGMGLGMGGTGDTAQIMPTLRQMSLREVDRQKRFHELKLGAVDAQDSIYARHMANFQDAELASKATTADIMRAAERQMLELANDPSAGEAKRASLMASAAQIQAQRLRELAELDAKLGDKVKQATSLSYRQAQGTAAKRAAEAMAGPAAAPAVANPKPTPQQFGTPEEYFGALAEWQGREEEAEQAAIAAQNAPKPKPKTSAKPVAPGNKPTGGETVLASSEAAPTKSADNIDQVAELYRAGRADAAVAAMSPEVKAYFFKLYDQSVKNLGEKAESSDAAADAFAKLLGESGPVALVPASERGRMVIDGGKTYFATTEKVAQESDKALRNATAAIALASKMANTAERFKGSGYKSDELRGEITSDGSELMAILSKIDEQGVIREGGDEERYSARAGLALKDFLQDPTIDVASAVKATLRGLRAGKQRHLSSLSTNWRDFESAAPKARRREAP